ncbi:hypothetical protein PTKIN_Ptkin17bG0002700 [Pterospermum kingtungense]
MFQAEWLAIRNGFDLALLQGYMDVILENDSLMAVVEVEKADKSMCLWGGLVLDIHIINRLLGSCIVRHVPRQANGCAHELAKMARRHENYCYWVGCLPDFCYNPDLP